MQSLQRITQKEIADAVDCSQATVSLVLSGRTENLSPQTVRRVREAAERLGYWRPVARPARTRNIACVCPKPPTDEAESYRDYHQGFIRGLQRGVESARHHLMLAWAQPARHRIEDLCQRIDGAVCLTPMPESVLDGISASVPVTLLNWHVEGRALDAVTVDEDASIRTVVDHLVAVGHERIAFLGHDPLGHHHCLRWEAFQKAMRLGGLAWSNDPLLFPRTEQQTYEEMNRLAAEVLSELARRPDRPTALVCPADRWALAVLACASAAGLRVPEDLSVVGFDCITAGLYSSPRLSSVRVPAEEMGLRASQLLLARIESPSAPAQRVQYHGELVLLDSIAPPNGTTR